MRSVYWKIFVSFWLATILIIVTTAWITSQIAQKSSQPAREQVFMDSYANAAVATYESGQGSALLKWLNQIGLSRHMTLYLISNTGHILSKNTPPNNVRQVAQHFKNNTLRAGIFTTEKLIVSHEIKSTSGVYYRLAAISDKPIADYVEIPWAGLAIRLILAIFMSGLICYLLSIYLTKPLRSLSLAAQSIATGKLSTRVGRFRGHYKDELATLSDEFDRMAEQLEQLVNSKERLLQDISHELRSPLARLHIAIELGRNKTQQLAETEFKRMETECGRLNSLISEILEFARMENSTTHLQLSRVNMPDLLHEVIQDANYESGDQSTRVQAAKIEPYQLMIDKRLIHRAIENILRNALHYSPIDKEITLSLWRHNRESIIIEIQDHGLGVPQEQLEKIFNPFYRVDASRAKKTGGYGLGLAIAARAVALHRGEIKARNHPDGGLVVSIILPIVACET